MKIIELIQHLDKYGLKTNPDKCQYSGYEKKFSTK